MTSKTKSKEEGNKKCRSFRICLNLNNYWFKASRYTYGSTYMNSIVTTNQKPITDTQKTKKKVTQAYYKRKSSNHNGGNKKKKK